MEGCRTELSQLKSANVLSQAKTVNEHRALKSDYDGLLAILKAKEEKIDQLTAKSESQQQKYQEEIGKLKEACNATQSKYQAFKKEQAYEAGLEEENRALEHREMHYALREMSALIEQLKV